MPMPVNPHLPPAQEAVAQPPRDPIVSPVIKLNPGFWYTPAQGQPPVPVMEAQVQLLKHKDHDVCNLIPSEDERQKQRFQWGVYRLGQYCGRDGAKQITPELVGELYEPDVMRLRQAQVDLHQSFCDKPNVICPLCSTPFSTALIHRDEEKSKS
ncbi:MAG TPA: hypothetical protein VI756_25850 [Blastocatellia bacterium]